MNTENDIKVALEKATVRSSAMEKFKMDPLFNSLINLDEYYRSTYAELIAELGERTGEHIIKGLLREAFYIQMVKSRGGAAQYTVRWEVEDIRGAYYETCFEIFKKLNEDLHTFLDQTKFRELLQIIPNYCQLPYEIPVDYRNRTTNETIHTPDNVQWFDGTAPTRAIILRKILLEDRKSTLYRFFQGVYKKIRTKVYLTDRAQTGTYQTNREQRWEVHPLSVQFSPRKNCMEIEYKLINQIFYFNGVTSEMRNRLEDDHLIEKLESPLLCPITLDPLSFSEFYEEILHPQHGKAKFQIGHMNPLKAEGETEEENGVGAMGTVKEMESVGEQKDNSNSDHAVKVDEIGHIASNISWVTADGNRAQGHLTLDDVRALFTRIAKNYKEKGYIS